MTVKDPENALLDFGAAPLPDAKMSRRLTEQHLQLKRVAVEHSRVINFYRVGEAFGEFSNFAPFPIRLKGLVWPTSEHCFQAQKFVGTPFEEAIRSVRSATIAAKMGRDRSHPLRPDWEVEKDGIMYEAVLAKFGQHPSLRSMLISTGDALIIEHTRNDSYWGDGGDGTGCNMLGHILMQVRKHFAGQLK